MGFRTNDNKQLNMEDRAYRLTEREFGMLTKSWAEPFATRIFPLIDESKFEALYCNNNGRPNTPVNVVIGSLILKEMFALTDEELLESIIFDSRYQYALHLTSDGEIPYSDRTPSRFRERLYKHELETGEDLLKEEIERLGGELASLMNIHSNIKRMDSVMAPSSCKDMSRLELIYTCVSNLVKAMEKAGKSEILPERLLRYANADDKNAVIYRMEAGELPARLEAAFADALLARALCGEDFNGFDEYRLLSRMLADQSKDGKLKPNKEISPKSLQNPSDEDATFRRKAGKGYQGYTANFVETCGGGANIVTRYDYEVNIHPDTEFGQTVIGGLGEQEERTALISDGGYASEENFRAAEEDNIKFVTTNLLGRKPLGTVLEFQIGAINAKRVIMAILTSSLFHFFKHGLVKILVFYKAANNYRPFPHAA
jgi:hypothetical protein